MKTRVCLPIVFALGLAAGPAAGSDQKGPPPDELQSIAVTFVDLLAAGDYAAAVKRFDATMTAALPADKLREVWTTLNQQAGAFKKRTGARAARESNYRVIYVACAFEKAVLEAKIVFDANQRIAGLFFAPPPAATLYTPPGYDRKTSYVETEVRLGRGEWSLPGTLSLPRDAGSVPGIVLVHGSGPLDRDESIGPNRPFRDLASGLASRGVAVLRYDKRTRVYAARLSAERGPLTLREETVIDAVEAVRLLRRNARVDRDRVFVLGHSLGGVALPRIAALEPGLAGFVMLATPSRPLEEVYAAQVAYLSALDGVITGEERAGLESIRAQIENLDRPDSAAAASGAKRDDLPLGLTRAYWDDLGRHDAREASALLHAPVLVLQGGRDYQVTAADYEGWQRLLAGREDATFRLYPSLNHLFMPGEGPGRPSEYETAGHIAPEVIDDLAAWLKDAPAASLRT